MKEVEFKMGKKLHIMAVGAHCGDMELVAGGVIAKYTRAGHEASIVHLTPGEKGHPHLKPEEYAKQKIEEAKKAAEILGAEPIFLPYRDAELPVNDEVKFKLAEVIREKKPDVIITHWKNSMHPDHANTYLIVEGALLIAALPAFELKYPAHGVRGLFYGENWEDPYGFEPDVYVDITSTYDVWVEAIKQYEFVRGGVSTFRYLDYYTHLAVVRGCLMGVKYAQAFMMPEGANKRRGASLPGFNLE